MLLKTVKINVAAILGFSLLGVVAADKKVDVSKLPPAADAKGLTYDKDIKPIFQKSCFKCHGAEKQKGKLRVDSLSAVLKGGEVGKVVEQGSRGLLLHRNSSRMATLQRNLPHLVQIC